MGIAVRWTRRSRSFRGRCFLDHPTRFADWPGRPALTGDGQEPCAIGRVGQADRSEPIRPDSCLGSLLRQLFPLMPSEPLEELDLGRADLESGARIPSGQIESREPWNRFDLGEMSLPMTARRGPGFVVLAPGLPKLVVRLRPPGGRSCSTRRPGWLPSSKSSTSAPGPRRSLHSALARSTPAKASGSTGRAATRPSTSIARW